jgi:hypothetical protein
VKSPKLGAPESPPSEADASDEGEFDLGEDRNEFTGGFPVRDDEAHIGGQPAPFSPEDDSDDARDEDDVAGEDDERWW